MLFFTALDFTYITRHIHSRALFLLWLMLFISSGTISPLFSSSILGTYWGVVGVHLLVSHLFVFSYSSWVSSWRFVKLCCEWLFFKGKYAFDFYLEVVKTKTEPEWSCFRPAGETAQLRGQTRTRSKNRNWVFT